MSNVWEPRRTPLAVQALASLNPAARASFDRRFDRPTDVQRHLWTAAARRESLVLIAPALSGSSVGLELAAQTADGAPPSVSMKNDGRAHTMDGGDFRLVVVEPSASAITLAEDLASKFGRCGFADLSPYAAIRTRVFAPFRDEPDPNEATLTPHFEQELVRMALDGRKIDVHPSGEDANVRQLGCSEAVMLGGYENSALVARIAAATDGPFHESPAIVLFAKDWSQALLAHVVAARVRSGLLDAEDTAQAMSESEREAARLAERLKISVQPEEHEAYALVSGLAMNRGNAIAVVRGARA